jgi:hypothetical protein
MGEKIVPLHGFTWWRMSRKEGQLLKSHFCFRTIIERLIIIIIIIIIIIMALQPFVGLCCVRSRNRKKPIDLYIRGTHALVCWDLLVSFYFYNGRHEVRYKGRILCARVAPALNGDASHRIGTNYEQSQKWPRFITDCSARRTRRTWTVSFWNVLFNIRGAVVLFTILRQCSQPQCRSDSDPNLPMRYCSERVSCTCYLRLKYSAGSQRKRHENYKRKNNFVLADTTKTYCWWRSQELTSELWRHKLSQLCCCFMNYRQGCVRYTISSNATTSLTTNHEKLWVF